MSTHAVHVLLEDFAQQSKKVQGFGGKLLKQNYLQRIGITKQTLANWTTGRCAISRETAYRIEDQTEGRVRAVDLLSR